MADETNDAGVAAEQTPVVEGEPSKPAVLTDDTPPAAHSVEQPLGTEFSLTVHESIAAKLGAEIKDVCYAIETDVKNGVHRLKGWLKIA